MRKIMLICAALIAWAGSAKAIDYVPESGFTNEAHVGMSISSFRGEVCNPKVGMTFGWRGEFMLPGAMGTFVNFGLDMTQKGANDVFRILPLDFAAKKINAFYLSLPIHVGYRYNILEDLGVFADFGPYFAAGFASNKGWFGKDEYDARRFDIGLGFRVGTEYNNHLSLTFGFDWGMADYYKPKNETRNTFSSTICLGYRF